MAVAGLRRQRFKLAQTPLLACNNTRSGDLESLECMASEGESGGAGVEQRVIEHGPLVDDVEDLLTPNCVAMLYNVSFQTPAQAASMHAVSLQQNDWKCVQATVENQVFMRPSHMPQGSTAGKKLLPMRKITVTEADAGWEGRQFYVPDVLLVNLDETWEESVEYLQKEFTNEMGVSLRAPLACWCAWMGDRVVLEGSKVALHREDLVPERSPLKDQSGMYARRSTRLSGTKRTAEGGPRALDFGPSPMLAASQVQPSTGHVSEQTGTQGSMSRTTVDMQPSEIKARKYSEVEKGIERLVTSETSEGRWLWYE